FTWSISTINGTGTTMTAGGGMAIVGNTLEQVLLDGVTLDNAGTATWTSTASFLLADGAVFNNQAGASFTIQTDKPIGNVQGAPGPTHNASPFTETTPSASTTGSGVALSNTGTVTGSSGTLALGGGGTSSGSSNAAGAALALGGGVPLGAAASVTGSNISFS